MSRTLNVSWLTEPRPGNFGDILSSYILSKYGYSVLYRPWNRIQAGDVICVGSIARLSKPDVIVLGSGIISKKDVLDPLAKWIWVRGPRTRNRLIELGGNCSPIYGDPALLLPKIKSSSSKKFKIGIVPHHVDYEFYKKKYADKKVINLIDSDVEKVIEQITECENIISSSLHGIITAHAYGIPAAWVKNKKLIGDDVKFLDYYESVNLEPVYTVEEKNQHPIYTLPNINVEKIHNILINASF